MSPVEKKLTGAWLFLRNTSRYKSETAEGVASVCRSRGLDVESAEEDLIGAFTRIPAVVVTGNGWSACFPRVLPDEIDGLDVLRNSRELRREVWDAADWFDPALLSNGTIDEIIRTIEPLRGKLGRHGQRAEQEFEHLLATTYTLPHMAICVEQVYPKSRVLGPHCKLIREAMLAFYSGHRAAAVAALVPLVESAITALLPEPANKELTVPARVHRAIGIAVKGATKVHYSNRWVPEEFTVVEHMELVDRRVWCLRSFKRWLDASFFVNTETYDRMSGLNRNIFAHGLSQVWQRPSNFHRLFGILEAVRFVEMWFDLENLDLFLPEMNDRSRLFWEQVMAQGRLQMLVTKRVAENYLALGERAPDLPTYDGHYHRAGRLEQVVMSDVVRPLRDLGWELEVEEVQGGGTVPEHVFVTASSGEATLVIALLFYANAGNDIYRSLDERADVILHLGAPSYMRGNTRGVSATVMPIDAWVPPAPKNGGKPAKFWLTLGGVIGWLRAR